MRHSRSLYFLASILFGILCGVGHLVVELFGPRSAEALALAETMQNIHVNLGGTETNAYLLTFGVSVIMGLMLIAYGIINLLVLRQVPNGQLPSRAIQATNAVVALTAFILALKYLFIAPIILTGLASLLFLFVLLTNRKSSLPV